MDIIEFPPYYTSFWDESENIWIDESAFLTMFGKWSSCPVECRKSFLFRNSTLLEDNSFKMQQYQNDDLIKVHVEMNFTDGWMEIADLEFISQYYAGAEAYESAHKFLGVIDYVTKLKEELLRQFELLKSGDDYYGDSVSMWGSENG